MSDSWIPQISSVPKMSVLIPTLLILLFLILAKGMMTSKTIGVTRSFNFFCIGLGIVFMWRGVWLYMDRYIAPLYPDIGIMLSLVFGMVFLTVFSVDLKFG